MLHFRCYLFWLHFANLPHLTGICAFTLKPPLHRLKLDASLLVTLEDHCLIYIFLSYCNSCVNDLGYITALLVTVEAIKKSFFCWLIGATKLYLLKHYYHWLN
jgi:hypothetical protein